MRLAIISFLMFTLVCSGFCQTEIHLSKVVDSLASADQEWRGLLRKVENGEVDTIKRETVIRNINCIDSLNLVQIRELFKNYGYPGYDKVGKESSHNFWSLVQHADSDPSFQEKVAASMKQEADKSNASFSDYAYLVDRVMVNTGRLQVYGTQMKLNADKTSYETKPCVEPEKLNERRKEAGLPPIETYIKFMNERYHGTLKKKDCNP